MTDNENPIKINFDENKIIDAILAVCTIQVNKDKLASLDKESLDNLVINLITQTCKSIMQSVVDDTKRPHIIAEMLSKTNLKYLSRAIH